MSIDIKVLTGLMMVIIIDGLSAGQEDKQHDGDNAFEPHSLIGLTIATRIAMAPMRGGVHLSLVSSANDQFQTNH